MSAYSPAPWRVEDTHPEHCCLYINSSPGVPGDVAVLYGDPTERMADARVVAAAPELLAALREMTALTEKLTLAPDVDVFMGFVEALGKSRDAIAKATGGAA